MELISVALVTGVLSHLLLIFMVKCTTEMSFYTKKSEHLCEGGQT